MTRFVGVLTVLAASAAFACMNSMRENQQPGFFGTEPPGQALLASANENFAKKDFLGALLDAQAAIAEVGPVYEPSARKTVQRAQLIAGQAALRLSRFEEAERYLAPYGDAAGAQPYVRARLAEARVGLKKFAEARPVLEELAKADLIPDALAWRALARARDQQGDVEGARLAVKMATERGGEIDEPLPFDPPPGAPMRWPLWFLALAFAGLSALLARRRGWILARARA